jgi:RNA polymerase sigma factor (sigma-70 family)
VAVGDVAEVADAPARSVEREVFDRVASQNDLWRAVRALPPRQRAAVVHRFVLDRSYAEIGEAMDSTEETARANVYQAVRKLREMKESLRPADEGLERSTR